LYLLTAFVNVLVSVRYSGEHVSCKACVKLTDVSLIAALKLDKLSLKTATPDKHKYAMIYNEHNKLVVFIDITAVMSLNAV